MGFAASPPAADTDAAGNLAAVWPRENQDLGEVGPALLVCQRRGAPWPSPRPGASGAPVLDDRGGLILVAFTGVTSAEFGSAITVQNGADAPIRLAASFRGVNRFAAAEPGVALLASGDDFGRVRYAGVDRLGSLGLLAPPRARPGGRVNARVNLWRPARVTMRLRGGPARASVTRNLPAGRSVLRLRLPRRAGTYLVQSAARERPGGPLLRQRTTIRALA